MEFKGETVTITVDPNQTHEMVAPTVALRWFVGPITGERTLQQGWEVVVYDNWNRPISHKIEWRDVPELTRD
jgi:hypothetical protein